MASIPGMAYSEDWVAVTDLAPLSSYRETPRKTS